uniref:C-type lectin domain-containing protein n=1 Tax=Magallana gigas TaxID=29159 RepID=K1RFL0_MAGGI
MCVVQNFSKGHTRLELKKSQWNFFMNSEYLLGLKAATWNNAQLDCSVKGAKLVEIESPEEDVYIRTLAHNLTDPLEEGCPVIKEERSNRIIHQLRDIVAIPGGFQNAGSNLR